MRRASSLMNASDLAVERVIDSKWDVVQAVGDKLGIIELVSQEDWDLILAELQEAQDFTGITVVAGDVAGFDPVTKVITVPTVKGDTGEQGIQGEVGPQGPVGERGPRGLVGPAGADGVNGTDGYNGANGYNGKVPVLEFSIDADGNLLYEVVDYIDGPVTEADPYLVEEW